MSTEGQKIILTITCDVQKLPMKDFAAEIRAHLDVEQFLSQAQLMLDVHETNVESIMDAMLHHLLDTDDQRTDRWTQD